MTALFVQCQRTGSAWKVWPEPEAIPPGAVREGGIYLFELRECKDALDADLLIDDVPLDALRSRDAATARWRWSPGFHAGLVEATLQIPGAGSRRFEVTTDPDLSKLTRADFAAMVKEVLEDTFALFTLSSFRQGLSRGNGSRPPPLARLEFLRSRIEEILDTVEQIRLRPRQLLAPDHQNVPLHRASRVTGTDILRSLRTGVVLREQVSPSRLPKALSGHVPAVIRHRRHRGSFDIPEHRQIKGCLLAWSAWLTTVAGSLSAQDRVPDAESKPLATAWARRLRLMARELAHAAREGIFSEVPEGPPVLQMTALFRMDAAYSRFHRLWLDMNLGLASTFGDFLQMPLARTFDLYELWCFLRLLRAASEEYGAEPADLDGLFSASGESGLSVVSGSVSVPIGGGRMICFKRRYREFWEEGTGQGTFSRTMVPDLVFAGTVGPDRPQRVIVLDAKYRIDEGLNDSLSSIHMYRDALVEELATGQIAGVVTAAYLLTPHEPDGMAADYRESNVPARLFHPGYRRKFRFGAVTLRPGMPLGSVRQALRTLVEDSAGHG